MLIDILKTIPDHRDPQGREYKLWEILYVSILAVLSNAKTYADIARFIEANFDELKKNLGLKWRRTPVISAIQKILVGIEPEDVEQAFRQHSTELEELNTIEPGKTKPLQEHKHLCFDGKKLNGSFSHSKGTRAQEIFNIFATHSQIIFGHVLIAEKESEIPALQELFSTLDLENVVVTADAIHCQKKLLKTPKLQKLFL